MIATESVSRDHHCMQRLSLFQRDSSQPRWSNLCTAGGNEGGIHLTERAKKNKVMIRSGAGRYTSSTPPTIHSFSLSSSHVILLLAKVTSVPHQASQPTTIYHSSTSRDLVAPGTTNGTARKALHLTTTLNTGHRGTVYASNGLE